MNSPDSYIIIINDKIRNVVIEGLNVTATFDNGTRDTYASTTKSEAKQLYMEIINRIKKLNINHILMTSEGWEG